MTDAKVSDALFKFSKNEEDGPLARNQHLITNTGDPFQKVGVFPSVLTE